MELTDGSHESALALAFSSRLFCQFAAIYLAGYWLFSQQPEGAEGGEGRGESGASTRSEFKLGRQLVAAAPLSI